MAFFSLDLKSAIFREAQVEKGIKKAVFMDNQRSSPLIFLPYSRGHFLNKTAWICLQKILYRECFHGEMCLHSTELYSYSAGGGAVHNKYNESSEMFHGREICFETEDIIQWLRPGFNFQNPHGNSQLSITPVPRI